MNACFAAEAAVTEASIGVTLGWDDEASRKACSQAMRLNSVIISGERGWQVVASYTEALLDFKASAWMGAARKRRGAVRVGLAHAERNGQCMEASVCPF